MLNYQSYFQAFQRLADINGWSHLHSPKSLAQAVLQESAELCAEFQWLTDQQSRALSDAQAVKVGHEIADVALYLFALCESLNMDLDNLIQSKQLINEKRFGADGR